MNGLSSRPFLAALLFSVVGFAHAQTKLEPGKLSGVLFFDYYSVGQHHDPTVKGKDGFWARRIYLTYDQRLSEKLTAQARLEAKDPGDFSTSQNLEPFFKDLWLRYTERGHKFTIGLIPTPTTAVAEERLGYRPFERTPLDLLKMGSTRDKGLSIAGPIDAEGKADYMVMIGDGSGTKSSKGDTKAYYGRVGYKVTPEIMADLYGDSYKKEGGVDWRTVKGELSYVGPKAVIGLLYASQKRTKPGSPDLTLNVFSVYGEYKANDKIRPFVLYDVVSDAVPEGDKIEYLKMSTTGKPTLFGIGVRFKIDDHVEIIPNFETVTYRSVGGAPAPGRDTFFRVTFSVKM